MPYATPNTLRDTVTTLNRSFVLFWLLLALVSAKAQNVAPRFRDQPVTPGRALQFTIQNGLLDTTKALGAVQYYAAGSRPLPAGLQPIVLRSGRDIQVYLSPAQTRLLPAVSYLQILVGGQPAYQGTIITSYSGDAQTPGSPIVVNYVVGNTGATGATNPLAAQVQQYKLSGAQPGYLITHNQNTLLVAGHAFWTDSKQEDPLWHVVIDTPNTVRLTGPPGEQFFGTVVLEPFPTSN